MKSSSLFRASHKKDNVALCVCLMAVLEGASKSPIGSVRDCAVHFRAVYDMLDCSTPSYVAMLYLDKLPCILVEEVVGVRMKLPTCRKLLLCIIVR